MGLVKLGDIARECRTTFVGSKAGIPIVGLEHLTPGDIELHSWDVDTDNTFNKSFKKGQVLLGRRRVYLKKAAVAPFDGICSGDITVIEAIPEKLLSGLLPFIIQNERFFDFALIGSAGSLSPRVKWEYLKDYELDLPGFEQQSKLVDLLTSANELKHSYQEMIKATDEIVKSQFIEMFGNPITNSHNIAVKKGSELFAFSSGKANTKSNLAPGYKYDCFGGNGTTGKSKDYLIDYKTLVIGRVGEYCGCVHITPEYSWITDNAIYIKDFKDNSLNLDFLFYLFVFLDFHRLSSKTGQPKITQEALLGINYLLPPEVDQQAFVSMAEQADKSKFELKQAIEKIEKVMRALMQ